MMDKDKIKEIKKLNDIKIKKLNDKTTVKK